MNSDPTAIPTDFEDPGVSGFVSFAGPILVKKTDWTVAGFVVEARHCNPQGICHGGWLSTFADVQLVRSAIQKLDYSAVSVRTISLAIDFLSPAIRGDWVEGQAEIVHRAKTMIFVQGIARVDDRAVLRMNATLSVRPRSPNPVVQNDL